MSLRSLAAVAGALALLTTGAAPPASADATTRLTIKGFGGTPRAVAAGDGLRLRVRVLNPHGSRATSGRLSFSLRRARSPRSRLVARLAVVRFPRTDAGYSRRLTIPMRVPAGTRAGRWTFVACVTPTRGARAACRSRPLRVTRRAGAASAPSSAAAPPAPPAAPPVTTGPPEPSFDAQPSLRAPLTGEQFYFVMADRFANGRTDNDHGGLPPDKATSGFDPTAKGWYHGGDLKGLTDRIDYIRGLGTTALWLTPSFKNKAVQPEDGSAGYHGYWITDFTQIDPHLGTNDELRALVDAAHARGMKVFFDIITNHTADVIDFREGKRPAYVSKDQRPFRTADGAPFDDRDVAGSDAFPALDASVSFPFTPFNPPGSETLKVPSWLNDVTLYHNRGNTTFVGENALYGDFFGLDDLFTEHPRVVQGMIDVYTRWIADFGIDGFRIDTMKHVNDEFWQRFAPEVLDFARAQGKTEFFMFGEVFDTTKPFTSHFTTRDRVQAVLDFPFQEAAKRFAAASAPTDELREFFAGDDWYTDADSNAYQLPTFLGNHDMGRIGLFLRGANPGAGDAELLARDRLAHELMYLSRGNPVIYYGDEQGFTGDGGDQDARQDMFASRVASYNDDDLIGTDRTTARANYNPDHPLYRAIGRLSALTKAHPALRNGVHQHRLSGGGAGPGIYAFSRYDRTTGHEYVVALNNAEAARTASVPTAAGRGARFERVYGLGTPASATNARGRLPVTVPALSAVVLRSDAPVPAGIAAPTVAVAPLPAGGEARDRVEVGAFVGGSGFSEVTFYAQAGDGPWAAVGTDDNAPYRVFHDVAGLAPGTPVRYRAAVRDTAGRQRISEIGEVVVAEPAIEITAPAEGGRVRGRFEVTADVVPTDPDDAVTFERRTGEGAWEAIGTDASQGAYTAFDDLGTLAPGTVVQYRATLAYQPGRSVTSDAVTATVSAPVTTAIVHYRRSAGDYADWGLHLWGDAIADGVATSWDAPRQRMGVDGFGAVYEIPLKDDTKPVNFIVHRPSGDTVPDTREPGGDRSFIPVDTPEIWLVQGDPTVYTSPPPP